MRSGYLVHHHIYNRLGESRPVPGHRFYHGRHILHQVRLPPASIPLLIGFQSYHHLDMRERKGADSFVIASGLGHDVSHLVEFLQPVPQLVSHLRGLLERHSGRQLHLYPYTALIQFRHEILADIHRQSDHRRQHSGNRRYQPAGSPDKRCGGGLVFKRQGLHPAVAVHLLRPAVDRIGKSGNKQQSCRQSSDKGEAKGKRHRGEQFPLHPVECEKRQVGSDYDQSGKENGLGHLCGSPGDSTAVQRRGRVVLPLFEDSLHHHDSAVHYDAEVYGSERQQIGRNVGKPHEDK